MFRRDLYCFDLDENKVQWRAPVITVMNLRISKTWEIFWPAELVLIAAAQEGLWSMWSEMKKVRPNVDPISTYFTKITDDRRENM
jgi:hypothetical protein